MPLTPEAVRNKHFAPTRFRPGYNEDEVDVFLDEVEAEIGRLLSENSDLRAQLAAGPPSAPDGAAWGRAAGPQAGVQRQRGAVIHELEWARAALESEVAELRSVTAEVRSRLRPEPEPEPEPSSS